MANNRYNDDIDRDNYGRSDDDWSDDIHTRSRGRINFDLPAPYSDEKPRRAPRRPPRHDRDDDEPRRIQPKRSFAKKHPILMNLIYICVAAILLLVCSMWFLDYWTFHGQERAVPEVKGMSYDAASSQINIAGLRAVVTDSIYDTTQASGTVVEQVPSAGSNIKKGGSVYLTIVAFSPQMVTVPDFMNVSKRQARSMFEGIGIKNIREVEVDSEYKGLVLGAKFNGARLNPGARIPVSASVTIEVGSGLGDEISQQDITTETDSLQDYIDNLVDELNLR